MLTVNESLRAARSAGYINAVVTLNDGSLEEAAALETAGLEPKPLVVKDVIYTAGVRTTMASRLFSDFVPRRDAEVVRRLRKAGYVVVGKGNTHEFASGATTTSSIFGPTRNPVDPDRIAGGSSGGSAAAVAAGIVDIALGTDTAGSVRIPASLCGVYGLRPTHGVIPRSGVFPLAPSLDDVGFLASSVGMIEEALKVASGARRLRRAPPIGSKVRLAVPRALVVASDEVAKKFYDLLPSLDVTDVRLPLAETEGRGAFTAIRLAEASAVHLKYRDRWGEYFPDVRRLMEKGLQVKATEYIAALDVKRRVRAELESVLRDYDALVLPSTAIPAPRISDVVGREDGEVRDLLTGNSWLAALAGAPAVSLPVMEVQGLPVGLQLIGRPGEDLRLLEVAKKVLEVLKVRGPLAGRHGQGSG